MKKIYLLVIAILMMANLNAQITVTSANVPQIGDTIHSHGVAMPSISVQHGGANQTWDFSSISGASAGATNFVPLSGSTLPTTFPQSNIVELSGGSEIYYKKNTSEYSLVGTYSPGSTRLIIPNSRDFLKFPITYNDVFNGTWSGTAENLSASVTYSRSGTSMVKADGYGTLILPYTTVNNVLRVITVYNYQDVYMGSTLATYVDTIYTWFNATTNCYIATYSVIYMSGMFIASQATYIDQSSFVSSVNDLTIGEKQLSFYPNPADNFINVENTSEAMILKIFDVRGSLIKTEKIQKGNRKIDISDLKSGVYFVHYSTESNNYTQKLVVN